MLQDYNSGKINLEAFKKLCPNLDSPFLLNHLPSVEVASRKLHNYVIKYSNSKGALCKVQMRKCELLRIMNCVQYNKCRFHGKIESMEFLTALQILVS